MFQNHMSAGQSPNLKINRLLMVETGTYNQQWRRPYESTINDDVIKVLDERLAGQHHYSPSLFSGIANQMVHPTGQPEKQVDIPYGWGERRMRFLMEVQYSNPLSGVNMKEIITGYTDTMQGIAMSGAVAPELMFFVNSTVHVRETIQPTPTGNAIIRRTFDNSQLLADPNFANVYQTQKETRMRPTDVFSTLQRSHLPEVNNSKVLDARTMMTGSPVKSNRSNNIATSYTASLLENYKNAAMQNGDFGQNFEHVLGEARNGTQEANIGHDPFLKAMEEMRRQPISLGFSWRDLVALDPNVDRLAEIIIKGQTERAVTHYQGQSEDWGVTSRYTEVAAILGQAIPALMVECMLTQIAFTATNRHFGVHVNGPIPNLIGILNAESFSTHKDCSQELMVFQTRLEREILQDISFNGQVDYEIQVESDLVGETRLLIALDGAVNPIPFVVPSFCDSLLVPVITQNPDHASGLANDFGAVFTYMDEAMGGGFTPGATHKF